MKKVILVSCVKVKRKGRFPAADLYISRWFIKARKLVEKTGAQWFILSAKHGLLAPDEKIGDYDKTIGKDGKEWAKKVQRQMDTRLPQADEIVILASIPYRKHLISYLEERFPKVSIPMKNMRIGEQLSWLTNAKTL